MVRIGVVQLRPSFGERDENLGRTEELLSEVEADLLVLPELFSTGYLFESRDELDGWAESPADGPTTTFLVSLARRMDCLVVGGFPEKADEGVYNSCCLASADGVEAVYRKIHLFCEEKRWFLPGRDPFRVYDTRVGRIGLMICLDWLFPEAVRSLALQGAQLVCHPSNIVLPLCQDAMVTRAIENRVFVLTSNRVGSDVRSAEHQVTFSGRSQVVAPGGRLIERLGSDEEGLILVDIDAAEADDKAITPWNDVLADRAPDCYYLG